MHLYKPGFFLKTFFQKFEFAVHSKSDADNSFRIGGEYGTYGGLILILYIQKDAKFAAILIEALSLS